MARTTASTTRTARTHKLCLRQSSVLMLLGSAALLSVGCSSDAGAPSPESTAEETPQVHAGAQPCQGFDTGFPGDEYCIAPPEAGTGFQLHYGPKNWDDPAEVEKFYIYPGEEVTDCVFVKTPNTDTMFMNEYHGRMRPGSHHMITYTQGSLRPDSDAPEDCSQGPDSRFLLGAQEPVIDISNSDRAPEHLGYAMKLEPNLQSVIQVHYINTTSEPIVKEAWVNVLYADPSEVTTLTEPIFWLGGLSMAVPAGATEIIKGQCETPADAPSDLHLTQITGHYHANTVRFSAWKVSAAGERLSIYESYDYQDPGFAYFNSQDVNPVPDLDARQFGSEFNGRLSLKAGDRVEWECEVRNKTSGTLYFENAVYTAEMCNMFGVYAPSMDGPWSCFNQ